MKRKQFKKEYSTNGKGTLKKEEMFHHNLSIHQLSGLKHAEF